MGQNFEKSDFLYDFNICNKNCRWRVGYFILFTTTLQVNFWNIKTKLHAAVPVLCWSF